MTQSTTRDPRANRPEYVLGVGDDELSRLGLQHRLWADEASGIWREAGFGPGQTILDVGCGPGFASFDLAPLLEPEGRVIAIDESPRYIERLSAEAQRRGLPNIDARVGDAQALDLAPGSIDGAWERWVMCFTPRPEAVVGGVAQALRPGGVFAMQEYFNYRTLTLAPRTPLFEPVVAAIRASWHDYGGDDDIGGSLPAMLRSAGLEVVSIRPLVRVARPGEAMWRWPDSYFRVFLPKIVEEGYLKESDRAAFMEEWARRSADPDSYFFTPPMVAIIARKPRG
ncbi:MAG: methyltransferase domain-containing protein [Phycisphaeraceae bacterium]|nr:methyltransferase domain-containing protein [Phycisphaeraceae bacterium]